MKIPDWTIAKYNKILIDNLKNEWDVYLQCVESLKDDSERYQSYASRWLEQAAFIKILPRQIGKTRFLMKEAIRLDGIVISNSLLWSNRLKKDWNYDNIKLCGDLHGINTKDRVVFIDEYDYLSKDLLNMVLCLPWKGVMMLSSCCKNI